MPIGLCECGCGSPTTVPVSTDKRWNRVKGVPMRFVSGHNSRTWGTKAYPGVGIGNGKAVALHRLRAEKALGKPLPKGAEVHHVDGSKNPDAPLVICQDSAYHNFLHLRMRVVKAGGNPNTQRICSRCKQVKDHSEFTKSKYGSLGLSAYCRICKNEMRRKK